MTARLEAVIEAQAVEVRRLTAKLSAQDAALAELLPLPGVVKALADRLDLAAQWAVVVDQALGELVADVGLAQELTFNLCDWHRSLAAGVPGFKNRHPIDPFADSCRRDQERRNAAADAGRPQSPFDPDSAKQSAYGFDAAAAGTCASGSEAEHDRQPG